MPPKRRKRKSRGNLLASADDLPNERAVKVSKTDTHADAVDDKGLMWWRIPEILAIVLHFCDDATLGQLLLVSKPFSNAVPAGDIWRPRCEELLREMKAVVPPLPESADAWAGRAGWPRYYVNLKKLAGEEKIAASLLAQYWPEKEKPPPKLRVGIVGVPCGSAADGDGDAVVMELGCTKTGGRPHVPEDFEWPAHRAFLGQYNLRELESCMCRTLVPTTGMLYFFGGVCDASEEGDVIHVHDATPLTVKERDSPPVADDDSDVDSYILDHPPETRLKLEEHIVVNSSWVNHLESGPLESASKTELVQYSNRALMFGTPGDPGGMLLGEDLSDKQHMLFQLDDVSTHGNGNCWIEISEDDLLARRWEKASYISYDD